MVAGTRTERRAGRKRNDRGVKSIYGLREMVGGVSRAEQMSSVQKHVVRLTTISLHNGIYLLTSFTSSPPAQGI